MRWIIFLLLIILILLLLILYLLQQIRKRWRKSDPAKIPVPPVKQQRLPNYNPNEEVIFFLKEVANEDKFIMALNERFSFPAGRPEIIYPCPCSKAIITVKGLTPVVIAQPDPSQNDPGDNKKPLDIAGEFGGALYSPNYYFDLPPRQCPSPLQDHYLRPIPKPPEGKPVLVAVLDTGLDGDIAYQYRPDAVNSCVDTDGEYGFNFINNTSNFTDDFGTSTTDIHQQGHGTPVTGLILQMAAARVDIRILPVKCLDKEGHASLLKVMCALAYAKKAGAKIINASLGFYSQLSEFVRMFQTFLEKEITTEGTIIVAAAGNHNPLEDAQAMLAPQHLAKTDLRNLDKHFFFPAAFSQDNKNIISVTTIYPQDVKIFDRWKVCPDQNYSLDKVQIGVAADTKDFRFIDAFEPVDGLWSTWLGSSFATPVVTGLLAATYHQFMATQTVYNRDAYLQWLHANTEMLVAKQTMALQNTEDNSKVPNWMLIRKGDRYAIASGKRAGAAIIKR